MTNKDKTARSPQPNGINPKVDAYLKKTKQWRSEIERLRTIILDCELTEELKWGKPCYTYNDTNIALIIPLKDHCALMFCKGALLKDAEGILIKVGENSQSSRWIKFAAVKEIARVEASLKIYIQEAIQAEKDGRKVVYKKTSEFPVPNELQIRLDKNPAFKKAFSALTPGRQRGYLLHFSAAKQSATRESRIEKCLPLILKGKGLHDHLR